MNNNKGAKMADIQALKNIIKGCCDFGYDIVDNYDFTQPDGCDESGSGGCWDLSGVIADNVLTELYECEQVNDNLYQRTKDNLQSLLYNLFCEYKTETDDDE